ncbi:copper resistance protein CopC [Cellulomonas sp. KRMCY2]|uniref:copper resistance CopC/CopD family protein n=1 Tax=Cellulomonas sp. KRMCY2 TaxID=1304865 RepID=UPI00045EACC0|nr:copper resistance protein CopC [Cellulomonas sp. KRMCY2]
MTWSWAGTRTRRTAILLATVVVLLLGAPPALAHGELARSDPPDGGMVAVGRTSFSLWFTDAVAPGASTFGLRTIDGVAVAVEVDASGADEGFVRITAEPLAEGTYVLEWTVLSVDDGHASRGSVLFGAGIRPDLPLSTGGGLPSAPGLVLRWLDLSAIMLAIGALTVSGHTLGSMDVAGRVPRRRALLIGASAAGVALVTGAITPLLRTYGAGTSVGLWLDATRVTLVGTAWGHLWMAREVALLVGAAVLWWRATHPDGPSRRVLLAAGGCLVAAAWLESSAGHSSTLSARSATAVLASAAHLVAAGVWVGGLITLAVCVIPGMRREPQARGLVLASVLRAFSPIAAVMAGVVVATGLYESGRHVPDLRSVATTVYGGTVAVKIVLVAVALTLAGMNTALLHPGIAATVGRALGRPAGWAPIGPRHFPTVVAAEVAVLVVAVGGAALLTSVATAREVGLATSRTTVHSANVDGLLITFEEVPAGPGSSRLVVRTRSTVRPEPGPVTGVSVALAGSAGAATNVPLERIEAGRYEAGTAEPAPGAWTASITVERDGVPPAVTEATWTVVPAVATGAGRLEIVTSALALLVLLATVGAGVARRSERPAPAANPLVAATRSPR